MNITTINKMTSRLALNKSHYLSNGYKLPPHYIGMLNHMWLFCGYCNTYHEHELVVRSTNDFKYICQKCNNGIEYVG